MAGVKISAATPDTLIDGVEMIPVSDEGVAKRITVDQIKNFTIDQIEAIAAGTEVVSEDKLYVLDATDGVLKPVPLDTIVAYATNILWNKTADAGMTATDLIPVKEGATTEKTVTAAILAAYIQSAIRAAILNVSDLDATTSIAATDKLLVTVGTTGKHITYANLIAAVYSSLAAYLTALTGVTAGADADVLYILQGGVEKKITLAQIKTYLGVDSIAVAPATTTTDYVPQWANTSGTLKDGLSVATTVDTPGTDLEIPTCKAVRDAVGSAVGAGFISGATDIDDALAATDTFLVYDASTAAQKKTALSRFWTYFSSLIAVDNTTLDATTSVHGFMPKLDKVKLDGIEALADVTDAANVAAAGALMISSAVDGTLTTGDNSAFAPTKLVYNKTCSDSTGHDVIGLSNGTVVGQILTIYLGTKSGTDNAIITPATALTYATITLDAVNEIATLQWQGSTVGWAILYTNGTVA